MDAKELYKKYGKDKAIVKEFYKRGLLTDSEREKVFVDAVNAPMNAGLEADDSASCAKAVELYLNDDRRFPIYSTKLDLLNSAIFNFRVSELVDLLVPGDDKPEKLEELALIVAKYEALKGTRFTHKGVIEEAGKEDCLECVAAAFPYAVETGVELYAETLLGLFDVDIDVPQLTTLCNFIKGQF